MKTYKKEEYQHLMKIKVNYSDNHWILKPDSLLNGDTINGKGEFIFRGDVEAFTKYLMKIKAKDNATDPPSNRGKTYLAIAQEIMDGSDPYIYVWNNRWQRNFRPYSEGWEPDVYTVLIPEENKMKIIKIGSPICIEGWILEPGEKIQILKEMGLQYKIFVGQDIVDDLNSLLIDMGVRVTLSRGNTFIVNLDDIQLHEVKEFLIEYDLRGNSYILNKMNKKIFDISKGVY